MAKCEICGKDIEGLFDGWPAEPRWCTGCIEKGMSWGMERYAEVVK